jgi:tetratricopeptide (TPR) repeat protein
VIGQTLGHYTIVEQIGAGGMGVVYRAYDNDLKRDVAIKVLADMELADDAARQRFRIEALTLSRSQHPNIAVVHEFNAGGALNYIVMEYIPGETLSTRLESGRLEFPMVLQLGRELTEGIAAAHRQGVVHGDLKPSNLRLTVDGHLKILDFGIARWSSMPDSDTRSSEDPRIAGTLAYMAPEQVRGQPAGEVSDVYAVGAVLYEMATGHRAHRGKNHAELLDSVLNQMPTRSGTNDAREASLEACIFKALDKDPAHRYQSARELLVDLKRIEHGTANLPPPVAGRGRLRAGIAATAAAVVLIGALLTWLWSSNRPGREAQAVVPAAPRIAVLPAQMLGVPDAPPAWSPLIQSLVSDQLTGIQDLGVVDAFSIRTLLETTDGGTIPVDKIQERFRPAGITLVVDSQVRKHSDGYELRVTLHNLAVGEQQFGDRALFADEAALEPAVASVTNNVIAFLQLQVFNVGADRNLRPWLAFRNRNIQAVKAFAQASEYTLANQEELAQRSLDRAIELDPSYVAPRIWRIAGLLSRGMRARAEADYRELLKLEPHASPFEQAMIAYAGAQLRGDVDEQMRQLERTLAFTPGNFILLFNLGARQALKGSCGKALETLEPLIAAKWQFGALYQAWAYCAIEQGHLQRVLDVLTEISTPQTDMLLEAVHLSLGQSSQAAKYRDASKRAGPFGEGNARLAGLYDLLAERARTEGHDVEAIALLERAVQQAPTSPAYHDRLAKALLRQQRTADAERAYHEALKADAGWLAAYLGLAEIAEARQAWPQAAEFYRAVIRRAPKSDEAGVARRQLARIGTKP